MAKFADKLAKKRKENNLSQEQLADRLNMSRQAVSKWESGSSYPDMEKIIEITKVLDCTLEDLLDDGFKKKKLYVSDQNPVKIEITLSQDDFNKISNNFHRYHYTD